MADIRVMSYASPRAGGCFQRKVSGAELLRSLTCRQKANLSYWIYCHNHPCRLLGDSMGQGGEPPVLNKEWVKRHRDRTPSTSERVLIYLRELIRGNDVNEQPNEYLLMAAGGCRHGNDLAELQRHTVANGWTGSRDPSSSNISPYRINASARIHVEEQLTK